MTRFKSGTVFALGLLVGSAVAGFVTADLYGRVNTKDTIGGLACRVYGFDAVRTHDWGQTPSYVCVDLDQAVPEQELFDDLTESILAREDTGN